MTMERIEPAAMDFDSWSSLAPGVCNSSTVPSGASVPTRFALVSAASLAAIPHAQYKPDATPKGQLAPSFDCNGVAMRSTSYPYRERSHIRPVTRAESIAIGDSTLSVIGWVR